MCNSHLSYCFWSVLLPFPGIPQFPLDALRIYSWNRRSSLLWSHQKPSCLYEHFLLPLLRPPDGNTQLSRFPHPKHPLIYTKSSEKVFWKKFPNLRTKKYKTNVDDFKVKLSEHLAHSLSYIFCPWTYPLRPIQVLTKIKNPKNTLFRKKNFLSSIHLLTSYL